MKSFYNVQAHPVNFYPISTLFKSVLPSSLARRRHLRLPSKHWYLVHCIWVYITIWLFDLTFWRGSAEVCYELEQCVGGVW